MQRLLYKKLQAWKQSVPRKPLLLKGARQTGKTYLLREFGSKEFNRLHYCNFQQNKRFHQCFAGDLLPEGIVQLLQFALDTEIDRTADILFFDEIQDCPRALTSLKYFSEQMPEQAICCAGSLLGVTHLSEPFPVGAVTFLELFPLSFDEFINAADQKSFEFLQELTLCSKIPELIHDHLMGLLKDYFVIGGMPEVVKTFLIGSGNRFDAYSAARAVQADLITAYTGDFAKYAHAVNAREIFAVFESIPAQLARENTKFKPSEVLNGARFSKLRNAIDWLAGAGLVHKVCIANSGELPFSAFTKDSMFKLYLADIGLLGALAGLSPNTLTLQNDLFATFKGAFCENFVAQEFIAAGIGTLHAWRSNTAEVEFMREVNGKVIPVEVKSGHSGKLKSLGLFAEKYKSPFRVRLSAHNLGINEQSRMHSYPLYLAGRFPLPEIK